MSTIISNSDLQKNSGKLSRMISEKEVIVTTHGKPKMVIVPYFEENQEWLEDYFEQYEIWKNQKTLKKELSESKKSGKSDFVL